MPNLAQLFAAGVVAGIAGTLARWAFQRRHQRRRRRPAANPAAERLTRYAQQQRHPADRGLSR